MLMHMRKLCEGKDVLILGVGREGKSTFKLLSDIGVAKSITLADKNEITDDMGCITITGEEYMSTIDDYDIVFKSPGIVLDKNIDEYKCYITSQIQEFMQVYRENIIGITGTKGKSTTTSLIHFVLSHAGYNSVIGGNIGIPAFELVEKIENLKNSSDKKVYIVLELSCHQLEFCKVSPHIAVLLNLYEEHLDHYKTYEKYVYAKENIYRYQKDGDILYCKSNLAPKCIQNMVHKVYHNEDCAHDSENDIIIYSHVITYKGNRYSVASEEIKLIGEHNYFDIGVAYAVAHDIGISDDEYSKAIAEYNPLPHRLEFAGEYDGIRYYDDSISTIGETAIQAIKSVPNIETVIIGGMDRGIEYDDLEDFLNNDRDINVILMYETGFRIYNEMKNKNLYTDNIVLVQNLEEAVQRAKDITRNGKAVVMSPAAASYGYFKNFEERGNKYKEYIVSQYK